MTNNEKEDICEPFSEFKFSNLSTRRCQPLSSVLPINSGFGYAVILTDAYFSEAGRDIAVKSFEDLRSVMGADSFMSAIVDARRYGSLTEGKKYLLNDMVDILISASGPAAYLRIDNDDEEICHRISAELMKSDITAVKPGHVGEFELCGERGIWYIRFRDDEPIVFLSAERGLINDLVERFPHNIMGVPPDFTYCL